MSADFSPVTRQWFTESFAAPPRRSPGVGVDRNGCPHVVAPTGSGKTLAAFLWAIDRLVHSGPGQGTKVVYVSPLKALAVDIERNLRSPLAGLARIDPDLAAITVESGPATPQRRSGGVS